MVGQAVVRVWLGVSNDERLAHAQRQHRRCHTRIGGCGARDTLIDAQAALVTVNDEARGGGQPGRRQGGRR
eukprot:4400451-Pleurochrysis_carterae.AAC.1